MYQLSIREEFVAQHYLTVPDCGPENIEHSHVYAIELLLEGKDLNEHGYLVDIDQVKAEIATILVQYRDRTLNETPAFRGLNPSIEHFSRIVGKQLSSALAFQNVNKLTVRMWEDRDCWASYTLSM